MSWIRLRSAILETTSGVEKVLAPVYTGFCTVLWLISVLQPQDIDPRNFVLVDDETLEISDDGKIIKNVSTANNGGTRKSKRSLMWTDVNRASNYLQKHGLVCIRGPFSSG